MEATGRLTTIIGPMFSGKSTAMVSAVERFSFARRSCVIIKHTRDRRFGEANHVQTHAHLVHNMIPVIYASSILDPEIDCAFSANDVIGIDEIQFFASNGAQVSAVIAFIEGWLARGKTIICAGLDTDWRRQPFPILADLVGRSHVVHKLLAVCMECCQNDALFSARSLSGERDYDDPIGGCEKYIALCRACYNARRTLAH